MAVIVLKGGREGLVDDADLEGLRHRFEALSLVRPAEFEASGGWRLDAGYSVANWLVAQTGTTKAEAYRRSHLAGHLGSMPLTSSAVLAGEVTDYGPLTYFSNFAWVNSTRGGLFQAAVRCGEIAADCLPRRRNSRLARALPCYSSGCAAP